MAEEFVILFIPYPIINQYSAIAIYNQKAAHGKVYQVVFVRRINFVPDTFWDHAKHGTAIEFKIAGMDWV
jgi:hypothetical protein